MKYCFLLFLISFYCVVYAQQNDMSQNVNLRVLPVKPDVAELGKYGDMPLNLNVGQLNYSIPIYTISVGSFQLPISLNYNYNGFKVEEVPGRVGLGWTLNAGGVIGRQIRGLPDEATGGYLHNNAYFMRTYFIPYLTGQSSTIPSSILKGVVNGTIDSEPDKFFISIGNIQAGFYFDEDAKALFLPHKNFKLINNSYLDTLKLIDDNGIKYLFSKGDISSSSDESNTVGFISAWQIQEISFPFTTDKITFEYDSYTYSQETINEFAKYKTSGVNDPCSYYYDGTIHTQHSETNINGRILKRINFPNGKIDFENISPTENFIQSISISNSAGTVLSKYLMTYSSYGYNNLGKQLSSVVRQIGGSNLPFYKMQYYGGLPEVFFGSPDLSEIHFSNFSYAQDFWGFYNGKNNSTLIPDLTNGNRSANYNSSVSGALRRIYYPTGGFTEIEYESNDVGENYFNMDLFSPVDFNAIGEAKITAPLNVPPTQPNEKIDTIEIFQTQAVQVSYTLATRSLSAYASVKIEQLGGGNNSNGSGEYDSDNGNTNTYTLYLEKSLEGELAQNNPYSNNIQSIGNMWRVRISPGIYILRSYIEGNATAEVSVSYNIPDTTALQKYEVGGIRVKRTITNDSTLGIKQVKVYKYHNEADNKSSGLLLETPIYFGCTQGFFYEMNVSGEEGVAPALYPCSAKVKFGQSHVPLTSYMGAPVLYKRVEEWDGENAQNGKTVYTFSGNSNIPNNFPFAPLDNRDWRKGLVESQRIMESNNVVQIKNSKYNYFDPGGSNKKIYALKVGLKIEEQNYSFQSFALDPYTHVPEFIFMQYDTVKSFAQGNNTTYVQQTSENTYSNTSCQLTQTKTFNSKGLLETKNYRYPLTTPANLLNTPIQSLIQNNQLAAILEETSTVAGNLQTKMLSNYYVWSNGYTLLRSVEKQNLSFPMEIIAEYEKYDDKGNLVAGKKKDDVRFTYLWDYNKAYQVAEVVNADSASIAYTSFEADGNGNWTGINSSNIYSNGGVTGSKFYQQNNFQLTKTGLNQKPILYRILLECKWYL